MGEYILSFLTASLVLGVIYYLSYSEKNSAMRLVLSLLLLFSVISPVLSLVSSLTPDDVYSFFDSEGVKGDTDAHVGTAKDAFALGVRDAVCEKFSLSKEEVSVNVSGFDFESMRAELIVISLSGKSITADTYGIREYIEDAGLGKCEVSIG